MVRGGGAWFADAPTGEPVGFLGLGPAPDDIPPAEVPELYVRALVTSRTPAARGAGRLLLDHAVTLAQEQGVAQVRVDCYAGNGGRWSRSTSPAGSPGSGRSRSVRDGPAPC